MCGWEIIIPLGLRQRLKRAKSMATAVSKVKTAKTAAEDPMYTVFRFRSLLFPLLSPPTNDPSSFSLFDGSAGRAEINTHYRTA